MIDKLLKIQKELKVPKTRHNSFGKYYYRNTDDIVEAVKPLCHEQGLVLTISDEVVEVGGRVYVKATARLSCTTKGLVGDGRMGDVSETVTATGYAREADKQAGMADAQITGSTSSYARKYALNGLFAIDDEQDADATNTHDKEKSVTPTTNNNNEL